MVVRTVASAARSLALAALGAVRYRRLRRRIPEGSIDIHDGHTANLCLSGMPGSVAVDLVGPEGEVTPLGSARVLDGRPTMTIDLAALGLAEGRHHLVAKPDGVGDGVLLQLGTGRGVSSDAAARDGLVDDAGGMLNASVVAGPVTSILISRTTAAPRFSRLAKSADEFSVVAHGLGRANEVYLRERTSNEVRHVGTLEAGTWSTLKVACVPAPSDDLPEYWDVVVEVDGVEHALRPMPTDIVDLNDAMRFPAAIVREGARMTRRKFYITRRGKLALKVTSWTRGAL